ncbi:hypothetical protein HHK36_011808 [Tetracentron sinense]|uniref:BRCT domain-containing protein n=1 Tax=Tetracentron sinense TaxID=13715 RepID=A0A834Z926_TETSI|nr:hypothetical protein HHK36_011808 [Tetracentron sinense]
MECHLMERTADLLKEYNGQHWRSNVEPAMELKEQDVAWLPAWLQQHQVPQFNEIIKDAQTPSRQACEDLEFLQGNLCGGQDVNLFPREEGRYNSCHLFLSGEDNSPISTTPGNIVEAVGEGDMSGKLVHLYSLLHFHLRLSSDGISQHTTSRLQDTFQTERQESNKVLSTEPVPETSAVPSDRGRQCKMDYKAGVVNLLPLKSNLRTSQNTRPQLLTKYNKDSWRQHQEKSNIRYLKNADIKDAVELSIAASEALAISELVNSGSPSEALSAAAVLEVALRVKQARLYGWEDAFHCPNEETDFLSDLDEVTMADAFEDVGLSVTQSVNGSDDLCGFSLAIKQGCSSSRTVSRVVDTPISENHDRCDLEVLNVKLRDQEVNFSGISTQDKIKGVVDVDKRSLNDSLLGSLGGMGQKELCDDPPLCLNTSSVASHFDPPLHQPVQTNSNVLDTIQDVDVSERMDKNTTISIPKFFISETSFFSESADVAPDQNSSVQKPETRPIIASLSSISSEGFCSKLNEGILFSQDLVGSSSLSLVDPLCSVVPCSISSENANATLAQNHNDIEENAGECLDFTSEFGSEKLQKRTLGSGVEFSHGEEHVMSMVNGDGSVATNRRQLTSLKNYSMLLPGQEACSGKGSVFQNGSFPIGCISGLLSSKQNFDCFRSSNKRDSSGFLPLKSTSNCAAGEDYEKHHEISGAGRPFMESMNKSRNSNEITNDGAALWVHQQEEQCSPLYLNYRTRRCRLQASKVVKHNTGEVNIERASIPKTTKTCKVISHEDRSNASSRSSLHSSLRPNAHEIQVPEKKRVRFLETEVELQQSKSLQKLQSRYQTRSSTRAGKRLKDLSQRLNSRTQEVIKCRTISRIKDEKRLIFQGLEFLLTGFTSQKEKELEMLIRKHGGIVLCDLPSHFPNSRGQRRSKYNHQQLPVLLSPKKLQTTKFLYGCAVNALMLKINWLTDSIVVGSVLPPENYIILPKQADGNSNRIGRPIRRNLKYIFDRVGIMLHGKHSFCTKFAKIIKAVEALSKGKLEEVILLNPTSGIMYSIKGQESKRPLKLHIIALSEAIAAECEYQVFILILLL